MILGIAYGNRGLAYANKRDWDRAIADLDRAIHFNPDFAEAYANRGLAYANKGDYDRAIPDFDKAIQLKPDDAEAYYYRGLAYANKRDWDRAIADLDRAIHFNPDFAEAYANRGHARDETGDLANALDDYRVAARLLPDDHPARSPVLTRIAEIEARPAPSSPSPQSPPPTDADMFSGTGIVVSAQGQVLTSNHVIEECRERIDVQRSGEAFAPARLLYVDKTNDLALLKIDAQIAEQDVAAIRTSPPVRNGEDIAVYGFPLAGTLSSTGNITGGNVSALAGPGDDVRFVQVTAPIQPGNSGGPLLDQSANVIGVVNAFLSDAQNVNFAVKAGVATSFLEAHGTSYKAASSGSKLDLPSIADIARRFTVLVVCQ